MLSQLYEGDDQNLVQTEDGEGENDEAQLAQLANMLNDLDDDEFAQVTGKMEEMEMAEENDLAQYENDDNDLELVQTGAENDFHLTREGLTDGVDFLMQADSETLDSLGQALVQTKAMVNDFIDNMQPETREMRDNYYAQTRDLAYNWLAQLPDVVRASAGWNLSQTACGQYFLQNQLPEVAEEIGSFFAQYDAVPYDEQAVLAQVETEAMDLKIDEASETLAQYSAEKILKLNELVEVKRQALQNNDDDEDYL